MRAILSKSFYYILFLPNTCVQSIDQGPNIFEKSNPLPDLSNNITFPFTILLADLDSPLGQDHVEIIYTPELYSLPPFVDERRAELIEKFAKRVKDETGIEPSLYPGISYSCKNIEIRPVVGSREIQKIVIDIQPLQYMDHITCTLNLQTELDNPEGTTLMEMVDQLGLNIPRILGVCSLVLTSDNYLIIQRRSPTMITFPNKLFCSAGGSMKDRSQYKKMTSNGYIPDPFLAMKAQLHEELGILDDDIESLGLIGVGSSTLKGNISLRFLTKLVLTRQEYEGKLEKDKPEDSWEYSHLYFVKLGKHTWREDLKNWYSRHVDEISPPLQLTIFLMLTLEHLFP